MRNYNSRLAGILGAVIIHLIAAIVFMIVKLGELNITEYTREYEISLDEISETREDQEVEKREVKPGSLEQVLGDDQELLNIARNLANKPDEKIDPDDYLDKVKEEMIRSGQLGTDNYIDEQKRLREQSNESEENVAILKDEKEEKPGEAEELASKYSGPTRIYYSLKGRIHTYLPVPIYKCEGSGKVTISIEVNPRGLVTHARLLESESSTKDECLVETAINAALISRFSVESGSLKSQPGTITYHFVAQQ